MQSAGKSGFDLNERKTFNHDPIGYCMLCGKIGPCEVHHKNPISLGGTNDIENLIYICEDCHKQVHKGSKSELVKAGMRNLNSKKEPIIGYYELYAKILQLVIETDHPTVSDVLEILNTIPIRYNARKDGTEDKRKYLELAEVYLTTERS